MNPLPAALDEYLALRRSFGYKLCEEGSLLRRFVAFAGERGAEFITTDLALTWATRQLRCPGSDLRVCTSGVAAGLAAGRTPTTAPLGTT